MFDELVPDPEAIPDPQGRLAPWLGVVLALALLPLLPGLGIGFLSDDFPHVERTQRFADALADWARPQYGLDSPRFYRPVVSLSLWATQALCGVEPVAFRLANVLLHLLGVAALVGLAHRLGLDARAAALAGLLHAWFPYVGGNVVWIVGRVDSFAVPLCLVTLWAYHRSRGLLPWRPSRRATATVAPRWVAPLGWGAFALALGTKEVALATLPILWALELTLGRGLAGLRRTTPYVLVAAGYLVLRFVALGSLVGGYAGGTDAVPGQGDVLGRIGSLLQTLWNLLVPWFVGRGSHGIAFRALPVLAACVLFLLGWERGGRVRRRAVFALIWVACASLPLYQMWDEDLPTNLRTYHFAWAGLALFLAGVVLPEGGWKREAFPALLTAVLLASCLCGAWRNVADHVVASRRVEALRAEIANAREQGFEPPFVLRDPPKVVGSAYALNFGLREAFRPPFQERASEVLPYRTLFPAAPPLSPLPATLAVRTPGSFAPLPPDARRLRVRGYAADDLVIDGDAVRAWHAAYERARVEGRAEVDLLADLPRLAWAAPGEPVRFTILSSLGSSEGTWRREAPDGRGRSELSFYELFRDVGILSDGTPAIFHVKEELDKGDDHVWVVATFADGTASEPLRIAFSPTFREWLFSSP